jgi:hypothetical protein
MEKQESNVKGVFFKYSHILKSLEDPDIILEEENEVAGLLMGELSENEGEIDPTMFIKAKKSDKSQKVFHYLLFRLFRKRKKE